MTSRRMKIVRMGESIKFPFKKNYFFGTTIVVVGLVSTLLVAGPCAALKQHWLQYHKAVADWSSNQFW